MESNILPENEPTTFEPYTGEELQEDVLESDLSDPEQMTNETTDSGSAVVYPEISEDLLTNETYMDGISQLVNTIDPDSVNEEVFYVDNGSFFNSGFDLPDYAVVYACNGMEVVFPTEYAEQVFVIDGQLVNLGSNFTAGLLLDGSSVNNYLSSEITIPTYHSATWYQYLQTYGQPYRIVDRYVNNYGSISSSTRNSVNVEWSGGNPWEGFTFDRSALFIIIAVLFVMLIFRRSKV